MTDITDLITRIFAENDAERRRALLPTNPDDLVDLPEQLAERIVDLETARLAIRTINDLDHLLERYPDLPTVDLKIAAAERCNLCIVGELKLAADVARTPECQEFLKWRQSLFALTRPGQN